MKKLTLLVICVIAVICATFTSCQKNGIEPSPKVLPQLVVSHPTTTDTNRVITLIMSNNATSGIIKNQIVGAFSVDPKGSNIILRKVFVTGTLQSGYNNKLSEVINSVQLITANGEIIDTEDILRSNGGVIGFFMKDYIVNQVTTFFIKAVEIDGYNYDLTTDQLRFDVTGDNAQAMIAYTNDYKQTQLVNTPTNIALSGYSTGSTSTFAYYYNGGVY